MQIHHESGELLVSAVLFVLFIIIVLGLSYFIPNLVKDIINRLWRKVKLKVFTNEKQ